VGDLGGPPIPNSIHPTLPPPSRCRHRHRRQWRRSSGQRRTAMVARPVVFWSSEAWGTSSGLQRRSQAEGSCRLGRQGRRLSAAAHSSDCTRWRRCAPGGFTHAARGTISGHARSGTSGLCHRMQCLSAHSGAVSGAGQIWARFGPSRSVAT
jgi:hypothetical protein